jgi:serine protease Do
MRRDMNRNVVDDTVDRGVYRTAGSVLCAQYPVLSTRYSVLNCPIPLAVSTFRRGHRRRPFLIAITASAQSPGPAGTLLAPKAFRTAAAKVQPSIVRIEGFGGIAPGAGGGGYLAPGEGPTTGLVISADGYIVTSTFNFLRKPPIITVVTPDGQRHIAELLGRDETRKICLLKADGLTDVPVPEFAASDKLRVGQWAVAVGVGFGPSQPAISAGIISATSRISGKAVQTDANTSPANYGGPLVDLDGRVIGICVPLSPGSRSEAAGPEWYDSGIGFAVPLDGLERIIERLKAGETLQHAFLGIKSQPHGDPPTGAEVKEVVPDSPAAKAGLATGDKIVSLGGVEILDANHLGTIINRYLAGDEVEVVVERDSERKSFTAELAKVPATSPLPQPPQVRMPDMPDSPPPAPMPPQPRRRASVRRCEIVAAFTTEGTHLRRSVSGGLPTGWGR